MRPQDEDDEFAPPMTPLIDIVFLLIIFFLVATTFQEEERDMEVNLPEFTQTLGAAIKTQPLTLNIHKDGGVTWGRTRIAAGDQAAFEALRRNLAAWVNERPGNARLGVLLRGDRAATNEVMVRLMALCQKAGIRKVSLAVSAKK